jgi:uncharacterized protein YacL
MIPIITANSRDSGQRKPNTGKVILIITMISLVFGLIIPFSIIFANESMEYTAFLFILLIIPILGITMILGYVAYKDEVRNNEIVHQTRPNLHQDRKYYRKKHSERYSQHEPYYWKSKTRFCSNCGELLDPKDIFCYSCGWRVE